jgi:isocitrate dehydrogenase
MRKIEWFEVYAGEKCNQIYGENTWLHDDTTNAFKEYLVEKRAAAT